MKRRCMQRNSRKEGPDVWQFRWSETRLDGKRLYHKKIVGTVEQYPDEDAARRSVVGLLSELSTDGRPTNSGTMTVAQLCDHFEQRELPKENTWRSHATKKIYKAYLTRWIRPHWQKYGLAEVRTIQVESWLRGLPLAKSSCAKIRNLMSVLFNHACRYELFDRNPIYLVRQSAKRRTPPATLVPAEIKALIDGLALRERTLVLLAASTGLRQSEIFGLEWGDIDFEQRFGWHTFRHTYSTLLRSVGTEFKAMQELLRHSSFRSTLDVYTQAVTPAKHAAQAVVMSLVFSSDEDGATRVAGQGALDRLKRAQKGRETRPFRAPNGFNEIRLSALERISGTTRLELATSAVTGQRSNQLNYVPTEGKTSLWWALKDLNLRPFGCKPNALTAELSALPEPL